MYSNFHLQNTLSKKETQAQHHFVIHPFPSNISFHQIINKHTAEKLFAGFDELCFVSFATSLRTLLKLFTACKFKQVHGIIGENVTDRFKNELKDDVEQVKTIAEKIKNKEWLIYIVKKDETQIHDKFYLLKNNSGFRIIIGSSNLTEYGLYGKKQKNCVMCLDYIYSSNDIFTTSSKQDAEKVNQHFMYYFNNLKNHCELFMQDLIDMISVESSEEKVQENIIHHWFSKSEEDISNEEAQRFSNEIHSMALSNITNEQEELVINIPKNSKTQKIIKKQHPHLFNEFVTNDTLRIKRGDYFKIKKESINFPMMHIVKSDENRVFLITDKVDCLTRAPQNPREVDMALKNIEDFCNTVHLGQTDNPTKAKMVFYEAILYLLNAPFAHELMKIKKETVGRADDSGLKYLFICGVGSNSKTQLVRYMLKILSGKDISPLTAEQFSNLPRILDLKTVFPVVIDDVKDTRLKTREDLFKNYWEKNWHPDDPRPQIILTTNYRNIINKAWALRRIKGLDFEVVFKKSHENSQKLNQIMEVHNPVFNYFSYLYLNKVPVKDIFKIEDELSVARYVMKQLYAYANRLIPDYFTRSPVEYLYDKNLEEWQKIFVSAS